MVFECVLFRGARRKTRKRASKTFQKGHNHSMGDLLVHHTALLKFLSRHAINARSAAFT